MITEIKIFEEHTSPVHEWKSPAMHFKVIKRCSTTKARVGIIRTKHSDIETCIFMPVGTQGTMKGITSEQLKDLDCRICLGNTYHLGSRPGLDVIKKMDGLHNFMQWPNSILTDSGGFQMVSLLSLANVTEDGVEFVNPHDGSNLMLTPEKSIEIQNAIGSDIMMQLDDVVHTLTEPVRMEQAMWRSVRWLDRCIAANKNADNQTLFAISQGGVDPELRRQNIAELIKRKCPIAIGGLSSSSDLKDDYVRMVHLSTDHIPPHLPIYTMGVGYAVDIVISVALGVDMFDCVYPTRTARFGSALLFKHGGTLKLKDKLFKNDLRPIDEDCLCYTCKNYTRAYLHTVVCKESTACHLLTLHNIFFMLSLMRKMRLAIMNDQFPEWVKDFFYHWYAPAPAENKAIAADVTSAAPADQEQTSSKKKVRIDIEYPRWVVDALRLVNLDLLS